MAAFLLLAACTFLALGVWQVQRLQWKHALIARVDARVHADPTNLPADSVLNTQDKDRLEYLRVRVSGQYQPRMTALVRAATELGTGYWVMTAFDTTDGRRVWINRGYVPSGTALARVSAGAPSGTVNIVGLVRMTEPGGSLLQANRPDIDRWYSRDVAALTQSRSAGQTAPVFIDAQREDGARPAKALAPVPGLTVIHFADNHLGYALTWFALAILSLLAILLAWRRQGRNVA